MPPSSSNPGAALRWLLARRQHPLHRVDDGLGLGVNLDVGLPAGLDPAQVGPGQGLGDRLTQNSLARTSPTVRLMPSMPM